MVRMFLLIIDVFLLNSAFLLSFLIRYGTVMPPNFQSYKDNFPFLTLVYILAFVLTRFFRSRFVSFWDLFKHTVTALSLGTALCMAFVYVFRARWGSFPSSVFLIFFPVGVALIFAVDSLVLGFTGRIKKKVITVGGRGDQEVMANGPFVETKHVDDIEDILRHDDIDEIVICDRIREDKQLNLLIYLLQKLKVNVVFSPAVYAEVLSGSLLEKNSAQFIATFVGRKSDCEEFLIRAVDILGSLTMLILFSPLMWFVWLLIRLTSTQSAFYKQVRVGKDGHNFVLYKFKTMINGAEEKTGPVLAAKADPRVTKFGRFLRDTRIDELPQLLNVIRGEMSLVGPRPERPHFVKLHEALRQIRLAVKPGLTGLAQVRNFYGLHPKHKIKYDYLYIQRRSLLLNLYILAKTVPVILSKRGQ